MLAAAIVLTRRPVLDFGARAYVDIPYLVLVLGALLVETRRPRAGAPVLVLLALAGLLRPEAWLFAPPTSLCCGWLRALARGPAAARRRSRLLAAAAPAAVGAAATCSLTGDPLHSLTGTRDNAARARRASPASTTSR